MEQKNLIIKIKTGPKARLENAGVLKGELKYTTDTKEMFIGDGTSNVRLSATIIETTYAALKALRNASGLTPGQQYRITDYTCTTVQENTQSAGHRFDIIVTADSADKLNENARACLHEDDTYFADSKLEAWKLKYCLDNDADKFAWADEVDGNGVIYRMIDEWNNDCPYDFKNIQFKRDEFYDSYDDITFTDIYYYAFSAYSSALATGVQSDIEDATILTKQEGIDDFFNNCHGNVIKPLFTVQYNGTIDVPTWELNDNLFINRYESGSTYFSCYNNTFGNNCSGNTFGYSCYSNTVGDNCYSNTFGDNCYSNTFGNDCYENTFGDNYIYNTFGNDCKSNTFGDNCKSNTFGNGCYDNTFSNDCAENTFGNDCYDSTFGDSCYDNTFSNDCYKNTFGDECRYNTFSNRCRLNNFGDDCSFNKFGDNGASTTFGNSCYANTFGDNCFSNAFGNSCYYNTFGNECHYLKISDNTSTHKEYIHVENGTQGASGRNMFDLYDPAILNKEYQVTFKKDADGHYVMTWLDDYEKLEGRYKYNATDTPWKDLPHTAETIISELVTATEDTGWQPLEITSTSADPLTTSMYIRKTGNVVSLSGRIMFSSAYAPYPPSGYLAQLPLEYRPTKNVDGICLKYVNGTPSGETTLKLTTDGQMTLATSEVQNTRVDITIFMYIAQ